MQCARAQSWSPLRATYYLRVVVAVCFPPYSSCVFFAMAHMWLCAVRAVECFWADLSCRFVFISIFCSPPLSLSQFERRILFSSYPRFRLFTLQFFVVVVAVLTYLFYLRHMMRLWGALTYTRFAWIFCFLIELRCAPFRNVPPEQSPVFRAA